KRALRIKAKAAKADQAHLVFEMAKHLEQYLVTKDKAFKDGKDLAGKDVIFLLDDEIVLDKAKVESLRTLFLNFQDGDVNKYSTCPPASGTDPDLTFHSYINGVYIASKANSADGAGAEFPENQTPNWPTMGAESIKLKAPGKQTPGKMTNARIGFVMASPVLLLQEGKREIKLEIDCKTADNLGFPALCDIQQAVEKALTQKYYLLKNDLFFHLDNLFDLVDTLFESDKEPEIKAFLNRTTHNFLQKLWIDCNLNVQKIDPANLPSGDPLFELYQKIVRPISEAGRAYLMGLLAKQNPYPFGYDLDECLDVALEPSCKPVFDCCEKLLLRFLLDTEARENCYLPEWFFKDENKPCLPFSDESTFEKVDLFFSNPKRPVFKPFWLDSPIFLDVFSFMAPGHIVEKDDTCKKEFIRLHCASESLFNISLSTEEGWYVPKRVKTEFEIKSDTQKFIFTITLDETEPPITFFNTEALKEDFKLDKPYPAAKLELNGDLKVKYYGPGTTTVEDIQPGECPDWDELCWTGCPDLKFKKRRFTPNITHEEDCCLNRPAVEPPALMSLYEIFRDIEIQDTKIDVTVCGIKKNIIVQNDENVQDINAPIYPFGVRPNVQGSGVLNNQLSEDNSIQIKENCPDTERDIDPIPDCQKEPEVPKPSKIGPNFYIGSQEILKKKWKSICVHLNWKDKPKDFNNYYAAYGDVFECNFETNISVLEQGIWKRELPAVPPSNPHLKRRNDPLVIAPNEFTGHYNRELFKHKGQSCACACPEGLPPTYGKPFPYEQTIKVENQYFPLDKEDDKNICEKLERLYPYSRDGFLRLSLENQDFFHKDYAFILSRQLVALAKFPEVVPGAVVIGTSTSGSVKIIKLDELFKWVCQIEGWADSIKVQVENSGADITALQPLMTELEADLNRLNTAITEINNNLPANPIPPNFIQSTELWKYVDGVIVVPALPFALSPPEQPFLNNIFPQIKNQFLLNPNTIKTLYGDLVNQFDANLHYLTINTPFPITLTKKLVDLVQTLAASIKEKCEEVDPYLKKAVLIPNEPWTPIIKNMALDYSACALKDDIDLVHLYPYEGTFKAENIELNPTLLPVYRDEGTLFIGLKDLRPGGSLNLLFQLAESTADSESNRAEVNWHYLSNNVWQPLRTGFEVISDDTKGLTVSGIVKFALPRDLSRMGNTIMPDNLYWIKASVSETLFRDADELTRGGKVRAICETIAVYAQAARATFKPGVGSDLARLDKALEKEKINKMVEPEAGVKKVEQPFESFGGRAPEVGANFYKRVSEHLRHKGRAIDAFDYENLVLEAYPEIFKVKCISHDLGLSARDFRYDLELAPGFVLLAVIPDLNKLKAGDGLAPKAPVSLLDEIRDFLKKRISPFVRLKVLNPRYEPIRINIRVKLRKGRNVAYYGSKLKEDLEHYLAPWHISSDSDKLSFGQVVRYSEVVKFVERLDYVDFISDLKLFTDEQPGYCCTTKPLQPEQNLQEIRPLTARSILTAGEICVEVLDEDCKDPKLGEKGYHLNFKDCIKDNPQPANCHVEPKK
ncbi:MAG: baseplate J/gp47 family protein, partial [Saprospiraceae bacterium]|nr:baseplate J/gp47 family protein [Saprospiraceae bacterium]